MSGNLVPFPSARQHLVVDTWPVMEWLKERKRVADVFEGLIKSAENQSVVLSMSVVNLGEVLYSSAREWGLDQAEDLLARVQYLPITFVSASDEDVFSAARSKASHRISYADAFAASLAMRLHCRLLTGDPDFRKMEAEGILQLQWLGA